MKPKTVFPLLLLFLWLAALPAAAPAATYTDGSTTFTVTFSDPSGSYSARVDAFWITDSTGAFVQNIRKDAATRQQYLYQWAAARKTTTIDGYSGATISTWAPVTVTWDCRNTNETVVTDGWYKLYVEFTDRNGQGPWTTNGLLFYKGLTNVSATFTDQTYLKSMSLVYTPRLAYDIAIGGLSPSVAQTNALVPLNVLVTNLTSSSAAAVTMTLSNATSGQLIGSQTIGLLAGNSSTNLAFTWNTTGLGVGGYVLVAQAGAVAGETNVANNTFSQTVTLRAPTHDLAIAGISVAAVVPPSSRTNVAVTVTNPGDLAESFTVMLMDDTDGVGIGTNQVLNLAAQASTTTVFGWDTTNASWGTHSLRAVASTVLGETATENNALSALSTVTPSLITVTYVTKSNYWRYHDKGTDLGTAWRFTAYNDAAWPLGRGPLGYGDPPTNTILNYGTNASAKYPTCYFRKWFTLTNVPTTLTMRLRRDDGAVVYLNGTEAYRTNFTSGTITYTTLALSAVSGSAETNYFEVGLPATNLVTGTNCVAVEIHQNSGSSSDLSFDLELSGAEMPPTPIHDVAVLSIVAPGQALPGVATDITVLVTNRGSFTESFGVVLSDSTDAPIIGASQISNLTAGGYSSATFAWQPPSTPWTNHHLRAVAGPVTGELVLANNTNTATVLVAPPLETNALVARAGLWRFNDTGSDLSLAPWQNLDYVDNSWPSGRAPFGYGDGVTTTNSFGPSATNKQPTCYFRTTFNIDIPPTWLRLRLRCDDGAVVYHNGAEVYRVNLTNQPVEYASWASAAVEGTNEGVYFESQVPVTNAVVGANVLAIEVHQVNPTDEDLAFDAELIGINPTTPRTHSVGVVAVESAGNAVVGDRVEVSVTVTNLGNATETVTVFLLDTNSNQIVVSGVVTNLAVGASATPVLTWTTFDAATGLHTLIACTVLDGTTNRVSTASLQTRLSGTGFGLRPANLVSALGGRCAALATLGHYLLVGAGATLEVWDLANPVALTRVGQVPLPGLIESLATSGTFAFAACGAAGVQFIDLANPALPVHVMTYDTSGHACGVAVSGASLFVADGVAGLRIVDISTPARPSLAGAYYTEGPARAVAAEGSQAYLLDAHKGLLVLNVANAAAPALLGTCAFHAGQGIAVTNGVVGVVDANNHFLVIDASTPSAPVLSGSLLLTNCIGQSVALDGSTAYVPALDAGVLVLDLGTPTAPRLVRALSVPVVGQALAAAVASSTLLVGSGFAGFQVFDVTAPANPVLLSDWPVALRACDVAITNDLACVAAGENGLRVYTLSNPVAPVWVGWFTNALNARSVALTGDIAVVGDGQYGLKIVSLTNPAAPVMVGSWSGTNLSSLRQVAVSGSRVVASDGRALGLFELATNGAPSLLATYAAPAFIFDLAVSSSRAYLACGNAGLLTLEITSNSLALAGAYGSPGFASGVAISGSTAYLAEGPAGWSLLDISNPTPVLLKTNLAQGPVTDVAVSGVLAAVGNGINCTTPLDVSLPLTPVAQSSFDTLTRTLRLKTGAGQVFIAQDDAGLGIGSVPADSDGDGLPDAWEQQIIDANPNDNITSIREVNPADDFDGDGLSNLAEYLAGTSPVDRASRFVVYMPPLSSGAPPVIQWTSVAGKTYAVHRATDLRSGFTLLEADIAATPPLNTYTDPAPGGAGFYIISVR